MFTACKRFIPPHDLLSTMKRSALSEFGTVNRAWLIASALFVDNGVQTAVGVVWTLCRVSGTAYPQEVILCAV